MSRISNVLNRLLQASICRCSLCVFRCVIPDVLDAGMEMAFVFVCASTEYIAASVSFLFFAV